MIDKTSVACYNEDEDCSTTKNANGIAEMNPICYRGYYYDTHTGLYYLQSRYYNPRGGGLSPPTATFPQVRGAGAVPCIIDTVAVMADIAILQGRKSFHDGYSGWQIAEDCVDSLSDYTLSEIASPFKSEVSSTAVKKAMKSIGIANSGTAKIQWASRVLIKPSFDLVVGGRGVGLF